MERSLDIFAAADECIFVLGLSVDFKAAATSRLHLTLNSNVGGTASFQHRMVDSSMRLWKVESTSMESKSREKAFSLSPVGIRKYREPSLPILNSTIS
ncbi:MAG: hypothetical protein ABSG92_00680 [Conexivisphaerales archaeon]|jgi:hypothetical protein